MGSLRPILGSLVALAENEIDYLRKHPQVIEFTVRAYVKSEKLGAVFQVLRSSEKDGLVQEVDTAQIRVFQWNDVLSLSVSNSLARQRTRTMRAICVKRGQSWS